MILSLLLGLFAFAFSAYFLHLFFQLNKAERTLQSALTEVEASMLQRYGRPKSPKEGTSETDRKKG